MIIRHAEHLKMNIQTSFKYLLEMFLFTIKKCRLIKEVRVFFKEFTCAECLCDSFSVLLPDTHTYIKCLNIIISGRHMYELGPLSRLECSWISGSIILKIPLYPI